jgi:hypothetical protein
MTAREQFEQWFCRKFSVDVQAKATRLHINGRGRYSNHAVQIRWEAWQACMDVQTAAQPISEAA